VEESIKPGIFSGVPGPGNPDYRAGFMYNGPRGEELDRFYLSPSQYALVLYATLIETGRMSPDGLLDFNRDGSIVEMIGAEHSPGHEVMSGSLGQGISQASGIAMARKLRGEKGRNVIFMSDGEFQIGQVWEAIQMMVYYKLDNILVYVDVNGCQCDGIMTSVMNIEPLEKRLEAFGMRVFRVDGHDVDALAEWGNLPPDGRPVIVLCDTIPYKGIPLLRERYPKFHYMRFVNQEEKNGYEKFLCRLKEENIYGNII
ncbi:MAG: 1-deoxy-D-xylulose-5-phosphate synthase N-terminal domain-containing protein, partial [Nitrospirota bacterium]